MPELRVFPVWQVTPRWIDLEVGVGEAVRGRLADELGLVASALLAVDAEGEEVDLDRPVDEMERLPDLGLSTRPVLRPEALLDAAHQPVSEAAEASTDEAQSDVRVLAQPMGEPERELALGLLDLGFDIDVETLDLVRRADSFAELPPGWNVDHPSPYRMLLACAAILSPDGNERLAVLEAQVAVAAEQLWQRLQLSDPDALDFRLHLFASSWEAFSELPPAVETPPPWGRAAGRVRAGWRRVVLHPVRDGADRLRQTADLARRLTVERLDPRTCRRLQADCGRHVAHYDVDDHRYDVQVHVWVRSLEERLAAIGHRRLLTRVADALLGDEATSSGRADDMAHGFLRRAGLLSPVRQTNDEGYPSVVWRYAAERVAAQDGVELTAGLATRSDGGQTLRQWITGLLSSERDVSEEWQPVFHTAVLDVACRLRGAIEAMLERRVFPAEGRQEVSLPQLVAAVGRLAEMLAALAEVGVPPEEEAEDGETAGRNELVRRVDQRLEVAEQGIDQRRSELRQVADPLFSLLRRWLARFGLVAAVDVERLGESVTALRRSELVATAWRWLRRPEVANLLYQLVDDLHAQLTSFAKGLEAARLDLVDEAERERRVAQLGGQDDALPLPPELVRRLESAIDALSLDEAVRRAFRPEGRLLDPARFDPEVLIGGVVDGVAPELRRCIEGLASERAPLAFAAQLESAVEKLFTGSALPAHGRDGNVGSLDELSHLTLILSRRLCDQLAGESAVEARVREALRSHDLPDHLPILVAASSAASGAVLSRCVHALDVRGTRRP